MVAAIKKVLITGSSGLLGSKLVANLGTNFDLTALSWLHQGNFKPGIAREEKIDLSCADAVEKIASLEPEVIIHAAALSNVDQCQLNPDEAHRHNVIATGNVVKAAKRLKSKLIYISTDHVFDGEKSALYNELDIPNPVNVYGLTKLKAEEVVKANLKEFIILRVSWLFDNPGKGFIKFVLDSAKNSRRVDIVCDKRSSPTYTVDVASTIEFLIKEGKFSQEIFHFTNNGKGCSWFEYAKEIVRICSLDVELKPIKLEDLSLPAPRPKDTILDNSKFLKIYKRPLRTWDEALEECLRKRLL